MDFVEAAADRHGALRDPDDDQGGRRPGALPGEQRRARAGRGVEHARPQASPTASCEQCIEINRLENDADTILRSALARLFQEEKDPIAVIKWKEIYETLERRPTAARTSPTSSRASSSRTAEARAMVTVVAIVVIALVFDYINGFHDAANSIATVVSTRVLTPRVGGGRGRRSSTSSPSSSSRCTSRTRSARGSSTRRSSTTRCCSARWSARSPGT